MRRQKARLWSIKELERRFKIRKIRLKIVKSENVWRFFEKEKQISEQKIPSEREVPLHYKVPVHCLQRLHC